MPCRQRSPSARGLHKRGEPFQIRILCGATEKVVIEINPHHPKRVRESSVILILPLPPHREPIPIRDALDRIGVPYAIDDPTKVDDGCIVLPSAITIPLNRPL